MSSAVLHDDYPRLRRSILRVIDAARAESDALDEARSTHSGAVIRAWCESHQGELDAVQTLIAALEVFDRRLIRECQDADRSTSSRGHHGG